jgi:hypothetical protein
LDGARCLAVRERLPVDLRDLAFVGCRLVSLYFGVQALQLVPGVLGTLAVLAGSVADRGPNPWLFSLSHVLAFSIWALASVVLWVYAQAVGRRIVGSRRSHLDAQVSRDDVQQVLFASVGLFIVVSSAADLAEGLYVVYALKSQGLERVEPQFSRYTAWTVVASAKTGIGLLLVLGASGMAGAIRRVREAGHATRESPARNPDGE